MSEPRARLLCRTGEIAGATYELGAGGTIGRDAINDVVLLAETVSGRHARIYMEDGAYFLEDVGSSNGTEVDGIAVTTPVQLSSLNVITFSEAFDVIFQIVDGGGSAAKATAPSTRPAVTDQTVAFEAPAPPEPPKAEEPEPPAAPAPPVSGDHTRVDLEAFAPMPVLGDAVPEAPAERESQTAASSGPTYFLIVEIGDAAPTEFSLSSGENTIGRSDDCAVTVPHKSLSRTHASISITPEGLVLKDLGSTNGTFVEDAQVSETVISDSGRFKLGAEVNVRVDKR